MRHLVRDTQLAPRGPHAQKPERLVFPLSNLYALLTTRPTFVFFDLRPTSLFDTTSFTFGRNDKGGLNGHFGVYPGVSPFTFSQLVFLIPHSWERDRLGPCRPYIISLGALGLPFLLFSCAKSVESRPELMAGDGRLFS